ncbi:MAG: hypothetical protein RIT28_514, partial [Pseudomonadota bacterium]
KKNPFKADLEGAEDAGARFELTTFGL